MESISRYAITHSPIAKIFQPHLQESLLEDPSKIFVDEPCSIYVERASGRVEFKMGRPRVFIRRQSTDQCEQTDFLVEWLTGGDDGNQCQETDLYGIVKLRYDDNVERGVTEAMMGGGGLPPDLKQAVDTENEGAKRRSHERVMKAVRRVYENMKRQHQLNEENKFGKIQPSRVELLCNYVLKHEIANEKARQAKITQEIEETLAEDTFTVDNVMAGLSHKEEPKKRQRKAKADVVQSDEVRGE